MSSQPTDRALQARGALRLWAGISLRAKLIVAFLLVASQAIGLVAAANYWSVSQELSATAQLQLKHEASTRAGTLYDLLNLQISNVQTLAMNKLIQDAVLKSGERLQGSPAEIRDALAQLDAQWAEADRTDPLVQAHLRGDAAAELSEYHHFFPNHVELFITDRHGALVAASNRISDYAQADEEWWQQAWEGGRGGLYVGQPTYDESSRALAMIIAVPIYRHETREVIGVLRSTYAFTAIVAELNAFDQAGSEVDLLFPNGYILHPEGDYLPTEKPFEQALRTAASADSVELTYEDERALVSLAPVVGGGASQHTFNDLGWYVIAYQPASQALAPVVAASRATLLTAVLVLGLASLAALGLARLISRPIEYLTRTVRRVAGGDHTLRLGLTQRDEIGELAQSVDAMTAALVERIAEAERLQRAEQASRAELERATRERIELQERMIAAQGAALAELTAPLIPISDTIKVMPLVGAIDAERASRILEALLRGVEQDRTTTVIIDITGVPVVDTAVAQALIQAAQALRLLGASVILTGTRPDVAQTLVALGVDLRSLVPQATLESGIAYALGRR